MDTLKAKRTIVKALTQTTDWYADFLDATALHRSSKWLRKEANRARHNVGLPKKKWKKL